MVMAHTAGPWTVRYCSHGGGLLRRGAQNGPGTHPQSSLQVIPMADATLCSAAPDLIDVAIQLVQIATGGGEWSGAYLVPSRHDEAWYALIEQARAAIAKATTTPSELA